MADYDLVVVGGGPAGYVGAIRAAQLGKKVLCVEKERAGGTCLNWGCIPTKSLLRNADLYRTITREAASFGIKCGDVSYDWTAVIGRSRKVADQNAAGIEFLFKKYGVQYQIAEVESLEAGSVTIKGNGKNSKVSASKILVSTGVVPRALPSVPFDGKVILSSRDALALGKQPKSIAIIGAGAIGVEFAYFFNAFGTETHLIEMMPRILPQEDTEISELLAKSFKKQGIKLLTEAKVAEVKPSSSSVKLRVSAKSEVNIEADVCLVAVGVQPRLPKSSLQLTDRGYVKVNDRYETSIPGIFAAGDIIGPPWLAHVASFEAIQAVEGIFKGITPKPPAIVPGCTYCTPQVASVGLTERAATEKGLKFKVGRFPFAASGKARAMGDTEGLVKLIFNEPHRELIGAHIIGAEATELIAEMGLAISMEATQEEIEATIHAHPTLSEAIHEAAGQAYNEAIHI